MDSFEFNKIAGAVLGTLLITFGLGILADELFHAETPEKPGFAIAVAEGEGTGEGQGEQAAAVPIATLLQTADPAKGEAAAKPCVACHTFENGGANKVGPNLWSIVNRPAASHAGFAYSDALKAKAGQPWTFDELNAFILDPRKYAPGTKMAYAGMKRDAQRADLLAYLRGLSDNPAPLPAAPAAAAEPAQQTGQPQEVQPEPGEGAADAPPPQQAPAQQAPETSAQ
ncbi:MAG TPA: cytochrome c family protein [Aestuariivirgaceae bacterium]|jgi:cytochrome c